MAQYFAMDKDPAQSDGQGEQHHPFPSSDVYGTATPVGEADARSLGDAPRDPSLQLTPYNAPLSARTWVNDRDTLWSDNVNESLATQLQNSSSALFDPALFASSADLPDIGTSKEGYLMGGQEHSRRQNLVEGGSTKYSSDSIDQQQATDYGGSGNWQNNNPLQTPMQVPPYNITQNVTMQSVTTVQDLQSQAPNLASAHEHQTRQQTRLPVYWGDAQSQPLSLLKSYHGGPVVKTLPVRAQYHKYRTWTKKHTKSLAKKLIDDKVYDSCSAVALRQTETFVNKVSQVVETFEPDALDSKIATTTEKLCREGKAMGYDPTSQQSQRGLISVQSLSRSD